MGILTLDGFRDELTAAMNSAELGDPWLTRRVNAAYRHIAHPRVFSHPGLQDSQDIPLVAATAAYALDSDLFAIEGVFLVRSNGRVDRLRRADFRRLLEDRSVITGTTSEPSRYARRGTRSSTTGGTINLDCLPTSTLVSDSALIRVYYWARPAALSADGDTTVLEELWDEPLWMLAASFGWANLGQQERSDYYRALAAGLINDYGGNLDFDANDPTRGVEIETESLRYQETSM